MQESIFLMADVYESSVEPGHQAVDSAQEDIPDGKIGVGLLVVELHEPGIFQKGNFDVCGSRINDEFFIHSK